TAFSDAEINSLVDVDPSAEAAIALVSVGSGAAIASASPSIPALDLPTRALSPRHIEYPPILAAHSASSLPSGAAAREWRSAHAAAAVPAATVNTDTDETIEEVILRRGS